VRAAAVREQAARGAPRRPEEEEREEERATPAAASTGARARGSTVGTYDPNPGARTRWWWAPAPGLEERARRAEPEAEGWPAPRRASAREAWAHPPPPPTASFRAGVTARRSPAMRRPRSRTAPRGRSSRRGLAPRESRRQRERWALRPRVQERARPMAAAAEPWAASALASTVAPPRTGSKPAAAAAYRELGLRGPRVSAVAPLLRQRGVPIGSPRPCRVRRHRGLRPHALTRE
jgi:hypothetical protein